MKKDSMNHSVNTNAFDSVRSRFDAGHIPRFGPWLMVTARTVLLLVFQGLTYFCLLVSNTYRPAVALRNWWSVYGTLVDICCLILLALFTRREGIRLIDLIGFNKDKLKFEIPKGIGIFLVLFPICVIGGGMLAQIIVYGNPNPELPESTFIRVLPLWAVIYSRLIWWPIWSFTEELTYNGYVLPRMIALTKSRWLSVLLVAFFFALQHSFLMLADLQFGIYTLLAFLPLTLAIEILYLRMRRLPPFILAHWLMDLVSAVFLLTT